MNASMQQKKRKNKGEEPEKINASFTNQKTEEETKQQGNVGYSGTNARGKKPKHFREENPSRGASVTLSRRFCEQIREDFLSFFTVLQLFFACSSVFNR